MSLELPQRSRMKGEVIGEPCRCRSWFIDWFIDWFRAARGPGISGWGAVRSLRIRCESDGWRAARPLGFPQASRAAPLVVASFERTAGEPSVHRRPMLIQRLRRSGSRAPILPLPSALALPRRGPALGDSERCAYQPPVGWQVLALGQADQGGSARESSSPLRLPTQQRPPQWSCAWARYSAPISAAQLPRS